MELADLLVQLLALVYSAAQDDQLWEPFLVRLADTVGGQSAALVSHDLDQSGGVAALGRLDPEMAEAYDRHFHRLDPYARSLRSRDPKKRGGVYTDEMLLGTLDHRTEFFNDFGARFNLTRMMTAIIPANASGLGHDVTGLTILCRGRDGGFSERERAVLEALYPHLVRALEVRRRLRAANEADHTLEAVFDHLPAPALIVDDRASVLRANRRAEVLLSSGDGLSIRNGVLTSYRHVDTCRIIAACRQAARQRAGEPSPGTTIRLLRPSMLQSLHLIISPLTPMDPLGAGHGGGSALVCVDEPGLGPQSNIQVLQRLYGLTPTEAEIAARIASGQSLEEISAARTCSLQTVQWHNKRILSKVECRSRSELVRRIALSVAQLTPRV